MSGDGPDGGLMLIFDFCLFGLADGSSRSSENSKEQREKLGLGKGGSGSKTPTPEPTNALQKVEVCI